MALLSSIIFAICFISVYSYEYVPVFMWDTEKDYSPLPALSRIEEEIYRGILLDKLQKNKVVIVFLEENLSPEDFTTFDSTGKNVFNSLSHIHNDAQLNYYPFVEAPLKSIENLGVKVSKVKVTATGLPDGTKVEPGQILIVNLNDAKENEERSEMLSRHDSLIASIYKSIVAKHNNVISFYTGVHSSWSVPNEVDENGNGRKSRHLMAVNDTEGMLIKYTDYLMYASDSLVLKLNDTVITLSECVKDDKEEEEDIVTIHCKDKSAAVKDLQFYFKSELGYWFLTSVHAEGYNITVRDVFAPFGFSYHCDKTEYVYVDRPDKDKTTEYIYTLTLPGFQVERFRNITKRTHENGFSDAYDCVGFTTAPIWSGLFVTFILAMIMTFGLCMIMDIKTMDRFDDPKGKTITINVVE